MRDPPNFALSRRQPLYQFSDFLVAETGLEADLQAPLRESGVFTSGDGRDHSLCKIMGMNPWIYKVPPVSGVELFSNPLSLYLFLFPF